MKTVAEKRAEQTEWAEQRRARRLPKIAFFDIVSQHSGKTVGQADDVEHAYQMAEDYRQNPDLLFMAIDTDGRDAGTWTLTEVLNRALEREIAS